MYDRAEKPAHKRAWQDVMTMKQQVTSSKSNSSSHLFSQPAFIRNNEEATYPVRQDLINNSPRQIAQSVFVSQFQSINKEELLQNKSSIQRQNELLKSNYPQQIEQSYSSNILQLGKKRKRKKDDSDDEYEPPSKRRKFRNTFKPELRKKVIKKNALKNKSGHYVCPGCGMPLADKKGKEIKTYYTSKSGKRHDIVSGQLDHWPPWSKRLERLKKHHKSEEEIRKDHDDPDKLRALCLRCNQSHKFETVEDLPDEGYSDEEYYSDDEDRDKEIWKNLRKDDDDESGAGAGVTS